MNRSTPMRRTPMKRAAPKPPAVERTRVAVEETQRKRMQARFANRPATPATADFDLPAADDGSTAPPIRQQPAPRVSVPRAVKTYPLSMFVDAPIRPQPKSGRYVSEQWRRNVASLPCVHCGIEGQTQAAHANHRGKGMSMKAPDCWTFPLCAPCHREFDQGTGYSKEMRRELADDWIIKTIKELAVRGLIRP